MDVPKHYVSQIINQYYRVNYFEYINLLRIEEAKILLVDAERKSMNIIEVAYTVGYNTKNTFNNVEGLLVLHQLNIASKIRFV
ncbi:MAG: AraC family transcriptional regulator [Bacteroidetes bacterium]|nr:AraC family transcriptional regulator [Bacteroidota bacterium]